MNELISKQKRAEFVATLAHLLADRGLRHWQGPAAAHAAAPKDRICCLTAQDVLQDLCLQPYQAGKVAQRVELVRLKLNWGFAFPARIHELLESVSLGTKMELTCRAVDLPDLAHNIAALMLGEVTERRNYVWDERAAQSLLPDTRERFEKMGFLRSAELPTLRAPRFKRALRSVP